MDVSEYCLKYFPADSGGFWEFLNAYFGGQTELPKPILDKYAGYYRKNTKRTERRLKHHEKTFAMSQNAITHGENKIIELIDLIENGTVAEIAEHFGLSKRKARDLKCGIRRLASSNGATLRNAISTRTGK